MSNTIVYKTKESPITLTLYNYQTGNYLSIFSGSYIIDTSGSYFSDVGVGIIHKAVDNPLTLKLSSNNYLGWGRDVSYSVTLYNYYMMTMLNSYSASALWQMTPQTLTDLSVDEFI
jgi:hypothetical protein